MLYAKPGRESGVPMAPMETYEKVLAGEPVDEASVVAYNVDRQEYMRSGNPTTTSAIVLPCEASGLSDSGLWRLEHGFAERLEDTKWPM